MSQDSHFQRWLKQALGSYPAREAKDLSPALPVEPGPVLIQSPRELLAAALGLEIVAALSERGGTPLGSSAIEPVRERLRESFGDGQWHHVSTEAEEMLSWLEDAFTTSERIERDDHLLEWDPETRQAVIEDAIANKEDVYLEFLGTGQDMHGRRMPMFHRLRLRPEVVEERKLEPGRLGLHGIDELEIMELPPRGPVVEGRRVPDGAPVVLALAQIRWLLSVRRLTKLQEHSDARVLHFPVDKS